MEKKILVPLTFEDIGKRVIQFADEWAQRTGAKLHFMHAINVSDRFYETEVENVFEEKNQEVITKLLEQLNTLVNDCGIRSPYDCKIRVGKPYQQILAYQEELNADLILMNALDHNIVERKLLGRNTDYVLHHARCPVYVFKEPKRPFSNKVIVPLGNISLYRVTDADRHVVRFADEWAERNNAEIYFMHATRLTERSYFPDIENLFESKIGIDDATENLTQKLIEFVDSLEVKSHYECIVRSGKPYHQIIDQQQALNAGLIVMSAHEHTTLGRILMGSTTDYVMNHARCPIYVYKFV